MKANEARRVFADLMQKARGSSGLTEADRRKLSQARQLLRRGKRPAMNESRKNPTSKRIYSHEEGRRLCECADRGCPVHPGKGYCSHPREIRLRRIDMAGSPPVDFCQGCADDAMESGLFGETRRNPESELTNPRRTRGAPRGMTRLGRALEVRYQRQVGRTPGYYKHTIKSKRAGVYTIPAGWVYVSGKSVLITETTPKGRPRN